MSRHHLCATIEIPDPGARGFSLMIESAPLDLFVVCRHGKYHAWVNSCPHRGTPLEWNPDDFLDDEDEHIVCATHGALFDIESGNCLVGPCMGQGLRPLPLEEDNDELYLVTE